MAEEMDQSSDSSSYLSTPSESDSTCSSDINDPTFCSLCSTKNLQSTVEISGCEELKSITEYIELFAPAIKKVKFACQSCLYKLYTVVDQNRLKAFKAERERRLAAVKALIISTDKSADESKALLPSNSPKTLTHSDESDDSTENEPSNHPGNVENLAERNKSPEAKEQVQMEQVYKDPHKCQLDVLYVRTESALATESGGTLDQYKKPPLQCRYCPKVFVRQKPFHKHMRLHQTKLLSSRSGSSCRGRSSQSNIVYACTDCSATFDSSAKLKTHCRIHLKRYYCTYCHKENLSALDHDFHEAECKGEKMAKEEFVETRRITRSIARSMRCAQTTEKTPEINKNAKSKKPSKSLRSKRTSVSRRTSFDDADDEDDAATSVAYTDYTELNGYIENWVVGTCRSECEVKSISRLRKSIPCEDPNAVIVSQKEYDIIMLQRLIAQSNRNVYTCCCLECDYITNTLRDMSHHEMVVHKFKTYYSCRKCHGVFTSKVYLDYHLYLQNFAEYNCHKCTMRFNYEYEYHYHLLLHEKNNPFPCLLCGNSFISNQDLQLHCLETGHNPKEKKKLITIDHTMTIVNETAPEPPPPKRMYQSKINILNLPGKPIKRPMYIVWPDETESKMFLGNLDFEYEPGRNCVRTQ